METAGINKGDELTHFRNSPEVSAFYVALKGYEIRDIESWSRFANGDSTVASPFDKGDVPFVEQAARETRTGIIYHQLLMRLVVCWLRTGGV